MSLLSPLSKRPNVGLDSPPLPKLSPPSLPPTPSLPHPPPPPTPAAPSPLASAKQPWTPGLPSSEFAVAGGAGRAHAFDPSPPALHAAHCLEQSPHGQTGLPGPFGCPAPRCSPGSGLTKETQRLSLAATRAVFHVLVCSFIRSSNISHAASQARICSPRGQSGGLPCQGPTLPALKRR